jgi:hypothetical protein
MGLDMYLQKKTYVKNWDFMKDDERHVITVQKGGQPTKIKTNRISYITEEVAQWRKANQIHGWFVENTEELVPNIRYYVTRTDLEVLLITCKTVLEHINKSEVVTVKEEAGFKGGETFYVDKQVYDDDTIENILPPMDGFFFGSQNVDDWYKQNIIYTIEMLEQELQEEDNGAEYEYYASW